MGAIRSFNPVKLFAGVLLADPGLIKELEQRLVAEFGPIDHRSGILPFEFTDYYAAEMGDIIDRVFLSFERLIEADDLPALKRRTNRMEEDARGTAGDILRPINIDPGYIELSKVVLVSTKNFYHRVYMGDGIFAEVTMHFKNNNYHFFPWTYPDYKSTDYQRFFLRMRQIYRSQTRNQASNE